MTNYKLIFVSLLLIASPIIVFSQNKPKIFFKEGDSLRLESNNKQTLDATITVIVPKNRDTTDKKDIPNQDTIINGKVIIQLDEENSTVSLSKVKLPVSNEFSLDSLKEKKEFPYQITIPRDSKDDKTLIFSYIVKNSKGEEIKGFSKRIIIYVKPYKSDTLRNYELWFMTGTNFDLFDGVKAEEFFFRANSLFRITDKVYGQVAFYKNRYNTIDTSSGSTPFSSIKSPNLGDSLYTMTSGNFRRTTSQTIDPLALQFDVLYKLTNNEESNFFATAGFDFSTTTVSINNKYNFLDTSFYLKTSKPDTVRGYNNFGTTSFPESISYKKPNYNLNVGFMWILNEDEVNIKAHFTAGFSNYATLITYYQSRGAGIIYNYESKKDIYVQMRMFATYKPLGLCFGLESFIRQNEVPAFNFTLSKAFDIKGFIKNFTPVSGLKIKD